MGADVAPPQAAQAQRADPQRAATCPAREGAAPARADVHRLQRALGNRAMHRFLRPVPVQPKLTVGAPDDEYEREADRVADEVVRRPDPAPAIPIQRAIGPIQRKCTECEHEEDEEEKPQRAPEGTARRKVSTPTLSREAAASIQALDGGGSPLPDRTRAFFEPRFGADFRHVRIHADAGAAEVARGIQAQAFTYGHNINRKSVV